MLADIYTILKHKLRFPHWRTSQQNATQYIEVDWYLGQDQNNGDHVLNTPIAYIEFLPVDYTTLPNGIQHGNLQFNVHLLTETVYGDERDMINETIGHQSLEQGIFRSLHNQRTEVDLNDTTVVFHESIVRKALTPHTRINKLVKSIQRFQCVAYDFEACATMVKVLATLDLELYLVKSLNDPIPTP